MEYSIIYSKRKSVSIKVNPDLTIVVRAPKGLSHKAIDEIVQKHSAWIENRLSSIEKNPLLYTPTKNEIEELKEKTKSIVVPLVEIYSQKMGIFPSKISFTSAKRVFGSCTSKKHLNFSYRLALYSYKAIEYVVVHELCHIKEMNHSKKFWAEVEKLLPDYKERKKLLKENL